MQQTWRDRVLYAVVWLACLAPLLSFVWRGFNDDLTANPIEAVLRGLGDWALRFLLIGLAITPVAKLLKAPRLIRYRRTIGLWAFAYVVLHLTTYIAIDQFFDWRAIGKDILKRPYITIGMTAFVLLIPLAVTSTNAMLRKLGPKTWKRLHQLIYVIVPLGVVHYYLLVKADVREPLLYGAIAAALLGWRLAMKLKPSTAPGKRGRGTAGRRAGGGGGEPSPQRLPSAPD